MSAGELAVLLACVVLVIGFAALIVVLMRVLDALRLLRGEVDLMRRESLPLLAQLRHSTDEARDVVEEAREDLQRFDRVLGSAEAISDAVSGAGRVTRLALSAPVIKATALATGTRRAARRLRKSELKNGQKGTKVPGRLEVVRKKS